MTVCLPPLAGTPRRFGSRFARPLQHPDAETPVLHTSQDHEFLNDSNLCSEQPISAASINIRRPTGSDQLFAPPARYPPTGMDDLEPFMVPGDPLADTGFFGSRRQSREGGFGARESFGLTSSQAFDSLDPDPLSSSARGEVDGGQSVNFFAGSRRVRPGEGVCPPSFQFCAPCSNPSTLNLFRISTNQSTPVGCARGDKLAPKQKPSVP